MIEKFRLAFIMFCMAMVSNFNFGVSEDHRRPIYIIGHMANSLEEVIPFLKEGANVLESDVQFYSNGSVKKIYHGCPGDCFRICDKHAKLSDYLKYLRNITDPSAENSYSKQLIMQFFDLKLNTSDNIRFSGREIARHILDYLWTDGEREQEIRALVYVNEIDKQDAISGFLQEFKDRNKEYRLKDVGFDGGVQNVSGIVKMFAELNVTNTWLGDGDINCNHSFHNNDRLKRAIAQRDNSGAIKKVYDWTVDSKHEMRNSLDLGVDGFITNYPPHLVKVINEPHFKKFVRAATVNDPPFSRFKNNN